MRLGMTRAHDKVKLRVMGLEWIRPLEALAMAKQDDTANAETLIEVTPADYYLCLCIRGQIVSPGMHERETE